MDPFTQLLLERTKASRSKLEAKLSNTPQPLPRKRRSPLKDDNILTSFISKSNVKDDSPGKRQCIDSSDEAVEDMKENNVLEGVNNQTFYSRKTHDNDLKDKVINETRSEELFDSNPQKRTHRLAKLAAQINSWEDDLKEATMSKPCPVAIPESSLDGTSRVVKDVTSSAKRNENKSPIEAKSTVGITASSPQTPKAMPRRRSSSFSASSQIARQPISKKKSFSAEKRTTTKTIVWDQAVVATLEAQGFVQSPSRSKLEYQFSPKSSRNKAKPDEEYSDSEPDETENEKLNIPIGEPIKVSEKSDESQRISVKKLAEKFASPFVTPKEVKDPAQLPISARVALFEKESQLQTANKMASLQKKPAATATLSKNGTNVSPKKTTQQVIPECSAEENKIRVSPSKSVGSHTFELHRRLFEHGKNWKENEISVKIREEREKDMEVVLNRWNHNSKKAAETAVLSVTTQRVTSKPVSESPKKISAPVIKKVPPVPPPLPPPVSPAKVTFMTSANDSDTEDSYDESLSDTESDDEALKNLDPVIDSEEEINRALAVVDAISTDEEETDLDSSILKEAFEKIESVKVDDEKPKMLSNNTIFKVPTCESVVKNEGSKSDEEQSLFHTISFYRRQKEMNRYTVFKNIVRNESSSSTTDSKSSTDDEDSASYDIQRSIHEKIKHLQEEIVAQQAVMRQASQALVLCRNNEAFQGSLEQIEGERLLLVAAQKRQACMNEVERLKTDGALGAQLQSGRISKGSLSMGDMKLVLKREFLEQTANGKSGDFVHFFIILIKQRGQVISTQMTSTMDGISAGALHFPNLINIRDLERDFNVVIEVYGLQTKRECVNREYKMLAHKKDKSKLTLTPKKRQSKKDLKMMSPKIQSPGGPNVICTSSFALIGYTALNIKTINKKSWNLDKIPFVSPLEGSLHMKVRCFSDFTSEEQGFLTMFDDVGGFGAWHRRWFVLSDKRLSYWKYPDDVKQKAPIGQIDLCQCITGDVGLVPRDICARPNTFMLLIVSPPSKENTDSLVVHNFKSYATIKVLLSADTKEERISWNQHLNKTLENLRVWDPNALRPMPDDFELRV